MKLVPLGDRVVLKQVEAEETTKVQEAEKTAHQEEVIAPEKETGEPAEVSKETPQVPEEAVTEK